MRVLIAHNRYRLAGGEERHVELLERGLRDAGVEVRLFERNSETITHSRRRRIASGLALTYRPYASGIGAELDEWRPDVVHFHNIWPLLTPSAFRIAKRSGAAVVLTAHNYRFACPSGTLFSGGQTHEDCVEGSSLMCAMRRPHGDYSQSLAYGIALELQRRFQMIDRWVDSIVAPSRFMADVLARAGIPRRKVHVIPNGLSVADDGLPRGRSALYIGRLSEEKGIRTLLEAARLAPDVRVAVAGDGPLAPEVQDSDVTYLGSLGREELTAAMGDAAFTLAPSECFDNQPFAVLESFAAARPVVATQMGGLPEIVRHEVTGLLVAPRAPDELARAMRRLVADPELVDRLGANAFEDARRRYSLGAQIREIVALYQRTETHGGG